MRSARSMGDRSGGGLKRGCVRERVRERVRVRAGRGARSWVVGVEQWVVGVERWVVGVVVQGPMITVCVVQMEACGERSRCHRERW